MTATRLADIGARDPHPLVLSGSGKHSPQQLAVLGLQFILLLKGEARCCNPVCQRVTNPLELLEARDPGLLIAAPYFGVQHETRKGLGA